MTPSAKNPRNHNFHAKILSEGYCCEWGYLTLCKARGQKPANMHAFLDLSRPTIYDHYRKLENGDYSCQGRGECLKGVIEEIEAQKEILK